MEAKEPLSKTPFSADNMSIIRKNLNLTSRGTLKLVQDLRMVAGSKVVELSAKEKMHAMNHKLDSFFEHKQLRFTREIKGKKITENFHQHVIVTNDISSFIDEVIQSSGTGGCGGVGGVVTPSPPPPIGVQGRSPGKCLQSSVSSVAETQFASSPESFSSP